MKSINNFLQKVNHRLRLQEGLRLTLMTLNLGLLITSLLLLSGRVYLLAFPLTLLLIGLGITLTGLTGAAAYAWLRPRPLLLTARLLDRRLNLEERLSTALEIAAGNHQTTRQIAAAQLADASRRLKQFNPTRIFPIQWPRSWLALAGLLLVIIAASLALPDPHLQTLQQQAKTEAAIDEQKTLLEEVRAGLLEDKALLETPQGKALQQSLDDLIKALEKDDLSLEEAMAAVSKAEQTLARIQEAGAQQEAALADLAQTFSQFDSTAELAEALQQRDLVRAAEALASAGNNLGTNPETAQELANALRQAAQTAQDAGNSDLAEALNQAAEALQQAAGQPPSSSEPGEGPGGTEGRQAAQEALRQAAEALAKAGEQLAGQEAIEQALANIHEARRQLAEANSQLPSLSPGLSSPLTGLPSPPLGGTEGGQVEGQGTGGGSGREDPGPGAEGLTAEQGTSNQMSTANGPNQGQTREYESLYAPLHLGGEGGPIVKPAEQGTEEGIPIGNAPVDPDQDPGHALVPYNQVYGQYADAAGQALDNSYIPLGMKDYIRNYFGALEPE